MPSFPDDVAPIGGLIRLPILAAWREGFKGKALGFGFAGRRVS